MSAFKRIGHFKEVVQFKAHLQDSGLRLPIDDRILSAADGSPVEGAGVLLRTRFRVRLGDDDDGNDPDSGFGDPIAFATTDADGAFEFQRPAGAYLVEFFSDDLLFRPDQILVESPLQVINVVAEPVE